MSKIRSKAVVPTGVWIVDRLDLPTRQVMDFEALKSNHDDLASGTDNAVHQRCWTGPSVENLPLVVVGEAVLLVLPFLFRNLLSVFSPECGSKLKIWKGEDSSMHPDALWYEYYFTCKRVTQYDRSVGE